MSRKILLPLTALLILTALSSCDRSVRVKADISEYWDDTITVAGLLDEEFSVTPNELAQLPCVARTAAGTSAKAGTVNAVGPLLDTFLEQYGAAQTDFNKIRFIARDDYRVVLRDEYLTDYEVVLSVSNGKEPLSPEQRPMRILIPGAESGMWEYAVCRIEFER